jgi:hypothetical protein
MTFRLVGGTDVDPALLEPPATQGNRKERKIREYRNGLPVVDPEGEADPIFRHIAAHRVAINHYDHCIEIDSDETHLAFEQMERRAEALILCRPTTRRGLIHQAQYLAAQFSVGIGWDEGAHDNIYLPGEISNRPWVAAFLRSLAAGLRKMGGEFEVESKGGQQ